VSRAGLIASFVAALLLVGCSGPTRTGRDVKADLQKIEDEETPEKLFARGQAFAKVGDGTRAEQYFAAALDRGADPSKVLPVLIRVCVSDERYRVALAYGERWLVRRPDDAKLRFVVGSLYASIGEIDEAKKHLELTVAALPDNADVHYALAVIYRDDSSDPVAADKHFREYLRLEPAGPHAEEAKGSLLHDVP
jgi:tetratricopeptide (TPR) repeat protein